ncbi:hypothetical protein RQP46_009208 [Phenoliferia psychrophenolica]
MLSRFSLRRNETSNRPSGLGSRHQSWSRVVDDEEGEDSASKRETRRRKKALDGRRRTQDWLSVVHPIAPAPIPRWKQVLGGGFVLAQGLSNVASSANAGAFAGTPIDATRLALIVNTHLLPLQPSTSSCTHQLSLLAFPNLSPSQLPIRLAWSSAATLWDLYQTQSNSTGLRKFVAELDFTSLGDSPGQTNPNFEFLSSRRIFDFAALTVTTTNATSGH